MGEASADLLNNYGNLEIKDASPLSIYFSQRKNIAGWWLIQPAIGSSEMNICKYYDISPTS